MDDQIKNAEAEDVKAKVDEQVAEFPKTWDEVFKHDRFKELNQKAQKAETELKKLQELEKKKEDELLKEQQSWKELAEKYELEKKELENKYTKTEQDLVITELLRERGVKGVAIKDALVLINRDDFSTETAQEKINALLENRPYLIEQKDINIGTSQVNNNIKDIKPIFKRSQLLDFAFYKAHAKEIDQAQREGRIVE